MTLRTKATLLLSMLAFLCDVTASRADVTDKSVVGGNDKSITISKDMTEVTRGDGGGAFIRELSDTADRIRSFNRDIAFRNLGNSINQCSLVISVGMGFGGICTISGIANRRSVAICDDDMVGHFNMIHVNPRSFLKKQLIEFVVSNCTGG